jgi:hypothetical protein
VERGEGLAQTMYTHVSKCKNYKIKGEREKKKKEFVNYRVYEEVLSGLGERSGT